MLHSFRTALPLALWSGWHPERSAPLLLSRCEQYAARKFEERASTSIHSTFFEQGACMEELQIKLLSLSIALEK